MLKHLLLFLKKLLNKKSFSDNKDELLDNNIYPHLDDSLLNIKISQKKEFSENKYNIDLETDNVSNYLNQSTDQNLFLEQLKSIDDILFKPSITMFEDLNSLFLIFIHSEINKFNQTKRIILHSKQKKTKKRKV